MKSRCVLSLVVSVFTFAFLPAQATVYSDSSGDLNTSPGDNFSGFTHLDLIGAEITNNATDIFFTIAVSQSDITSPNNWGNYMIGIDSVAGGSTTGGNPGNAWTRPISMSSGMDYWLGSWVNGGGGQQVWSWTGSSWSGPVSSGVSIAGNSVTFSTSLASLGLSPGNTFSFDVYSSGGGGSDSAVDALADPSISVSTWGQAYDSGSSVYSYTVTPIPEPATLASLALLGSLMGLRLVRRRV